MAFRKLRSDRWRPGRWWGAAASVVVVLFGIAGGNAQGGSGGINRAEHLEKPYVILVSMDGFRADYLDRFILPNMRRAMQRGVRARSMVPVFPSLTFPNHYSLVTGLFPEHHGIVGNSFYDPARAEKYSMDTDAVRDGTWYRGEPIWVTAETQGMVAGCFFWPGSEAPIKGVRPTFARRYDGRIANADRVKGVLQWLALPTERRPHVLTLYFSELDDSSHAGPVGDARVERAARSLDHALGQLLDGIDALPIKGRVYVLITSDHGMADTSRRQTVSIESLVDLAGVVHTFVGPVSSLHVRDGDAARATQLRDQLNARLRNGRAYLRRDLPERFHYDEDPRAGDVIVVMDEGWTLRRSYDLRSLVRTRWGAHGWDPDLPSMRAIFVATGPGIRAGHVIDDVRNVDVYPLMAELLELRMPESVDGETGHLRRLIVH